MKKKEPLSQIPSIIGFYTERIRSISRCAKEHIEFAEKTYASYVQDFIKTTFVGNAADPQTLQITVKAEHFEEFRSRVALPHQRILAQSLLIFGFSTFDAFLGTLLRQLY